MFDRHVSIDPNARFLRLGGYPPRVTMRLLIAQLAVFLLFLFSDAPPWLTEHLALSAQKALLNYELWQPLSALWIHLGLRSFVFDMVVLWLFGSALERWWGNKRFLLFFCITGVMGLVVGMFAGLAQPTALMAGTQGAAAAMLVACSLIFPQHYIHLRTIIPIRARTLCLLSIGLIFIGGMISRMWFDIAIQIGGAIPALLFMKTHLKVELFRAKRKPPRLRIIKDKTRSSKGDDSYLN